MIPSDWDVLRANNPHLKNIAAIKILIPGQVIVLCNTTTAKELNNYKSQAEKAELKLEKFFERFKFDPLYFANSYDQLHEIKNSDFVGIK